MADALRQAQGPGIDRADAQWLLAHLLGRTRTWLAAHGDQIVEAGLFDRYRALCSRLANGEPLAYLTGEIGFHGLTLQVSPAVLIPRPDTEVLVDWALELLAGPLGSLAAPRVIDLGTGSGAIALAVRQGCPRCEVTATDASAAALQVARGNAACTGLPVEFAFGDWWQAVPSRSFDLVVSNPSYIAGNDPHLGALGHEPQDALTPGGDGLSAIKAILSGALLHLRDGASLLLEHGWDQGAQVRRLLSDAGLTDVTTRSDLAGRDRCTGGRTR